MVVLKAIGKFFAKIWNWIKNTAWVQPLLIVGVIFGVIFSIPSISNWIEDMVEDAKSSTKFYEKYQKSLDGGESSAADKLVQNILDKMDNHDTKSIAGDKYFLMFVAETCPSCEEARPGFKTLKENFGGTLSPIDDNDFKLITIFTDEETDEDTTTKTAFQQFLDRRSYFFEQAGQVGKDSDYYLNGHLSDNDLGDLESGDPDDFLTPTLLLIDFTDNGAPYGISEVMFGVTGDTKFDKATLLLHCWDHTNEFSSAKQ